MTQYIISFIVVVLLFIVGSTSQAYKKGIKLGTSASLSLIERIRKFFKTEITIKRTKQFNESYKDIKMVKVSKSNLKVATSINKLALALFIISIILIIINLNVVSGNLVSETLYSILSWLPMVKSSVDVNTLYTATVFSMLSFSMGQLYNTWKSTTDLRKLKKLNKSKELVVKTLSSKQIYDELIKKDKESLKNYKGV